MAAYMTGAVLLSSIDITYKWLSPLVSMGEAVDWSATAGLQAGSLGTNNNEGWFGGGLVTDIHLPGSSRCRFSPSAAPRVAELESRCGSSAFWHGAFICVCGGFAPRRQFRAMIPGQAGPSSAG